MRLRNVKNKEEIMNSSSYLVKNPYDYKGKWKSLFGNDNPIYIEIGMGKGKFIIENALNILNRKKANTNKTYSKKDIQWVVTVPAIWNEHAKQGHPHAGRQA